jgi:AraC-like DNA-binding protein
LKHKIKYSIANIKVYLGFYEEAVALFEECIYYFSQNTDYNNQKGYLKSLNGMAKSYSSLGKYDLSSKAIAKGTEIAKQQNFELDIHYFAKTEGINEYFKKNYQLAMQKLDEALPTVLKNDDIPSATAIYFYKGKCLLELGKQEKAMEYFFKVDKTFDNNTFITPELRENYEILIAYYKGKNTAEKQLEYVNKLLKADVVLNQNYKYLLGKMHKEYDTKGLNEAKIALENQLLKQQSKFGLYGIIAFLITIVLSVLVFFNYKKHRIYSARFEALMEKSTKKEVIKTKASSPLKTAGIKKEIVDDLLKKLDLFEKENKFLQKGLTMALLVEQFKTNSSYLSKVINQHKDKNFSNYLNKLRIEYAIDLLKTERITQKYSIKALSEMTGFSTTQHFSDAFQQHAGLKPTYFMEQLDRSQLRVV